MTPELGDIGLVHTDGTVGDAIRTGEALLNLVDHLRYPAAAERYNHVVIYVGPHNAGDIVEAQPGGVRFNKASSYDPQKISWTTGWFRDLAEYQKEQIAATAISYAVTAEPYSFLDYAAITAHAMRLPLPYLRTYIASSHHLICSQLADRCYKLAGYKLFKDDRWEGYVTPMDIASLRPGWARG